MAIDRDRRAQLNRALTQLVEGTITNVQCLELLDLCRHEESPDRAVRTIGRHFDELCMDERKYRFTGVDALNPEDRAMADRCRLFLQTDREYEWPEAPSQAVPTAGGGAAIFLLLPLGVVLLLAAAGFRDAAVLVPGLVCLGLSGLLFWGWFRRKTTPEWRAYWARGERAAWPFLRQADCDQARAVVAPPGAQPPAGS